MTTAAGADAGHERERLRQQALLRTLLHEAPPDALQGWLAGTPARIASGLQAHAANAGASAGRALAATFPTVQALVGDAPFAAMARGYWRAHPPERGDLACFGALLPAFIAASEHLSGEPYLADVARLDWLLSCAEHAADAEPDGASFGLLAEVEPDGLRLAPMPGVAVMGSPYPVVTIWQAHQHTAADRFTPVQEAFARGSGECAVAWRQGWRARAEQLTPAESRFMLALLGAQPLGTALTVAVALAEGPTFVFEAWLLRALDRGWLRAAERERVKT